MNLNHNPDTGREFCLRGAFGFTLIKPRGAGDPSNREAGASPGGRDVVVTNADPSPERSARIKLIEYRVRGIEPLEAAA